MTEHQQLIAYLATLFAIVVLVGIAAVCAATGRSLEAVGVGGAVTGLIGVIRMPTSRDVRVSNAPMVALFTAAVAAHALKALVLGAPVAVGGGLTYFARSAGWPWARIGRIALPILAGTLLIGLAWLAWSVFDRTRIERDAAVADVLEFRRLATDATVPPTAAGDRPLLSSPDAKAALAGVFRDRDDARSSLARVDREAKAAKARSDTADAELARAQVANGARLATHQPRIDELQAARPSADAAADAAGIDQDSKAAWEGWK